MIMRLARLALAVVSTSTLAVLAAACSDPVPPTPQGAWNLNFISPTGDCKTVTHSSQSGSVTKNSKNTLLVAGVEEATITCVVSGTNTFSVSGSGNFKGQGVQISIPAIDSSATAMKPAHGGILFSTASTAGDYTSTATACDFYFIPGTGEGVTSGRIWVAFTCPTITQAMSTCALGESFAIFENCGE